MKILSIVGARPQFIKAAMVSREIRKSHTEMLLHTGQHYDEEMSQIFFDVMGIPEPDYNLEVGSGLHGWQKAKMLEGIEPLIMDQDPDWVLVYGDTNSTLAGALAAVKLHVPVAHVEAGLRSHNMAMPEEVNRRLTDHVSKLLLCPTEAAVKNLAKEGLTEGVHNVGDVMYDAALVYGNLKTSIMVKNHIQPEGYYLLTVHRPSNTDHAAHLKAIFGALDGHNVIFPAHPRTVKALDEHGLKIPDSVKLIKPVNYIESLCLVRNARKLLTDSGGMQKEAYFFGTPCITLRDETEWVETVKVGWNVLVGADPTLIRNALDYFEPEGDQPNCYGDGKASEKIVKLLQS